jgi:hypothetical protein
VAPSRNGDLIYFNFQAELNAAFGLNLSHQLGASQQQQQQQQQDVMTVNDVNGDPSGCVAAAAAAAQAVAAATNTGCSVSSSNTTPTTGMITTIDLSSGGSSSSVVGSGVVVQTSGAGSVAGGSSSPKEMPKRLHVSNIPFRFRDPDLRAMFGVCKNQVARNKNTTTTKINNFREMQLFGAGWIRPGNISFKDRRKGKEWFLLDGLCY